MEGHWVRPEKRPQMEPGALPPSASDQGLRQNQEKKMKSEQGAKKIETDGRTSNDSLSLLFNTGMSCKP